MQVGLYVLCIDSGTHTSGPGTTTSEILLLLWSLPTYLILNLLPLLHQALGRGGKNSTSFILLTKEDLFQDLFCPSPYMMVYLGDFIPE